MLKLKFQYSATWCKELTHWKRPMSHWKWWKVMGKDQWCWEKLKVGGEGDKEKGTTEDEMVGCHHWLNGHEFEQTPGDNEGQGSLECCSPWGHEKSDKTEWLNNNNIFGNYQRDHSHLSTVPQLPNGMWVFLACFLFCSLLVKKTSLQPLLPKRAAFNQGWLHLPGHRGWFRKHTESKVCQPQETTWNDQGKKKHHLSLARC